MSKSCLIIETDCKQEIAAKILFRPVKSWSNLQDFTSLSIEYKMEIISRSKRIFYNVMNKPCYENHRLWMNSFMNQKLPKETE